MGNDGGSVVKRKDLVVKSVKEKVDLGDLWSVCSLSGRVLEDPVVSDWQGKLYNKEAVLELLIGERSSDTCDIKSIKDVAELNRTFDSTLWVCPVSRLDIVKEGDGRHVVHIVTCGHCGEREAVVVGEKCVVCGSDASDLAVVPLNPKSLDRVKSRLDHLKQKGLTHSLAKSRKRRRTSQTKSKRLKDYVQ